MNFNTRRLGFILGTLVPKDEIGVNTGYVKLNPPENSSDRTLLYITNKEYDFTKLGEKPAIFSTCEFAKMVKTSIDKVYEAALNDTGDDILFLIKERN